MGVAGRGSPAPALLAALALLALAPAAAAPRYSSRIVHTQHGAIRGVIVEPASRRLEPVEAFLGVPYAGQPPRLGAPPPPPRWPGARLADAFAPVCPQRHPDISNRTAALARMPLGVYHELRHAAPFLANQSEDCLYLNIYVPGSGARGVEAPYAVVVWAGAGEWGSGNALDGAVLAARARLVVLTLNYRVGLLGYLTSGSKSAAARAGGAALLDVAAALRWAAGNVAAFGGDPARVTLAGHAGGAALANALLILPEIKGLVSRVMLLSGSALGPEALAPDPTLTRAHVAQALGCAPAADTADTADTTDIADDWLTACVESRPLAALLAVEPPRARFLAGWAPSVPGAGEPTGVGMGGAAASAAAAVRALHASDTFLECALAIVVTTTESYHFFNEDEIRHGFEEEHRNRVLRTFVRNVYRYHRNEIWAAARNEYTDWEKPIQHPINIRDAALEALSDAAGAAPAVRLAQGHARRGAPTYLAHLAHASRDPDYPARLGSVPAESLAYFLGLPLVGGARNYSRADAAVADAALALLAAFAKGERADQPAWPRYELATQQYLVLGSKVRVRSHYRGHKMALWLHLVPQLHRRAPAAPPRHHQFRDARPDMFAGDVFPELADAADEPEEEEAGAGGAGEEDECSPPPPRPALPAQPAPPAAAPSDPRAPQDDSFTNIDSQYYSYTVALGATVGAGCFLLALNVLVLGALCLRRPRPVRARPPRARRTPAAPASSSTTSTPAAASPRKSTLKRSSETSELKERPPSAPTPPPPPQPPKKRVQIQEISV